MSRADPALREAGTCKGGESMKGLRKNCGQLTKSRRAKWN